MIAGLDPPFAAALRRELVARVSEPVPAPWWRRRHVLIGAGAVVALAAAGGGAAVAAGNRPSPGANEVTYLTTPVTATLTGTQTVGLGTRPADATVVVMSVICLTPGTIGLSADGAAMTCDAADVGQATAGGSWTTELPSGRTDWTFTADPGVRYQVTIGYASAVQTEWGVNADGYTYGVEKSSVDGGGPVTDANIPDLLAVSATNGRPGYAWEKDLAWAENGGGPAPTSPTEALARQEANTGKAWVVPVYESDGKTKVGEFIVGSWDAPTFVYLDGHSAPGHNPQR